MDYSQDKPWTLKPYHELTCPVLDDIRQEVLEYLKERIPEFLDPEWNDINFWQKINSSDLAKACPSVLKYMKSLSIPIREISIGVLPRVLKDDGVTLHIGEKPKNIKINFPILNTRGVYTEWYDIPQEDLAKMPIKHNAFGKEVIDLDELDATVQDLYNLRARYEMTEYPIVFNSWIAHRVKAGPDATFPRIILAVIPIEEPRNLLEPR